MSELQVFISYRRDDTAGYARALADALGQRLGPGNVFVDVDDISAGQPFSEVIDGAVGRAQVLLVLIGPRWRGERPDGSVRLMQPDDFVRREVAAALTRGMRVVPLLFDGAAMPAADALPPELRDLAGRNAMVIDATAFPLAVERLLAALGAARAPSQRRLWTAGAVVAVAAAVAVPLLRSPAPPTPPAQPPVDGDWAASVRYDWGAEHAEAFHFEVRGTALAGRASFLGVPRAITEGQVDADGLRFATRTQQLLGGQTQELVHRYRGRVAGDTLELTLQTEGDGAERPPVRVVARRVR